MATAPGAPSSKPSLTSPAAGAVATPPLSASATTGGEPAAVITPSPTPIGKRRAFGMRYSLKALGGRMGDQWERERRDTLFLMGGTLMTGLVHFPSVPVWASVGFLLLFFWRLGLVLSGRWLPGNAVRWLAAIACTAAIYAQYRTLIGREVGVTILLLFLGLKLLEMRARRDLFVVLFLCFFLLLTAFFEDQSMMMAGAVLIAVVLLLTTMVTMQFGQQEAPIGARFKMTAILLLQALPIAAVMFVLFPRLQTPLWAMPDDKTGARMGLSDTMRPGSISELSTSEEVAFRVVFQGTRPPEASMYWRGPVLTEFDGTNWRATPDYARNRSRIDLRSMPTAKPVHYTLTLEPHYQPWLFALEAPIKVEGLSSTPRLDEQMQLASSLAVANRVRYEVESRLDYQLGVDDPPRVMQSMLRLPERVNPRTRELAARWQNEEPDPARRVMRVMALFSQAPFRYTLTPPLWGVNGIDEFLFDTGSGFCEHYASAMAFLLRAMAVPARVVTGYQGGQANPVNDSWIVRQGDAHAWVEAWLPGRGWVRYDPVTAIAPERVDRTARTAWAGQSADSLSEGGRLWQTLSLNLDAITNSWNQWILSYDDSNQKKLLERLGLSQVMDDWRELAGLLAATLALLIGGVALFTLHPRLPKDPIERWYHEFCDRLAAVGLARASHESAGQHLERISRGLDADRFLSARQIVASYNSLRYGDHKNRLSGAPGGPAGNRRTARQADLTKGIRRFKQLVKSFKP